MGRIETMIWVLRQRSGRLMRRAQMTMIGVMTALTMSRIMVID